MLTPQVGTFTRASGASVLAGARSAEASYVHRAKNAVTSRGSSPMFSKLCRDCVSCGSAKSKNRFRVIESHSPKNFLLIFFENRWRSVGDTHT